MTRPDIHGAIVRSLTDTQRERLRGFDLTNIADAVIRELGLREESRTLQDGAGGITTNWRTGETTVHSRPATRQCRYVTDWTAERTDHP